ncbi:SET domain-containing protein SmydA-8 [Aedes albopictus]|uniref:SET domain-containing protein n=1 Tax=Aedes albopictus TaxID=7160 RepID=A0ABM1Y6L8_AEDAL|nr:SET domain-containing protein SmydA-8 [Aedes albopictus]XP_029710503.1 SET domain-containing protein SmydA-8 [Aedes albopictus]XP_029710504.1 SET domain-containing protein SmydA-8 [Aedes albopictus]XP_029710505.1 SET domain-containing protein SmydA-8 [Aedes albopictus]XP_029710506.1 SET domain-containing protein SmydA-8 [Aedes albopictus]XP_029710507.1 SET domain-containing protein SmydA-8 [Aedes albopictus]
MELSAASKELGMVRNGNPESPAECDNSSDSDRLALVDPENIARFKAELLEFLDGLYTPDQPWDITVFEGYGRGMVATRDIAENELIFLDRPILLGPRVNNYDVIFCASCCRIQKKLTLCSGGCRLPVCSECDISAAPETPHTAECRVITSWEPKDQNRYCKTILYALTSIRGFLLDDLRRSIVLNMEAHPPRKDMTTEVERILKDQVFSNLSESGEDVQYLRKIVDVLNTNAFETSRMVQDEENNDHEIVLRGLYILGALMNHCCRPNIRYVFDSDLVMRCYASKPIPKGAQIFNNYSKTLWGTQHRIIHLCFSKHFLCGCDRCRDPTEMGTYLGALKCVRDSCPQGRMVSMNPMKIASVWQCDTCGLKMNNVKITKIQEIAGRMILNNAVKKDAAYIVEYLSDHVSKFLLPCNQFTVELKLQAILKIQDDAALELQVEKDKYCREILEILRKLDYGECYVKGVLCYELFKVLMAIARLKEETFPDEEALGYLRTAWTILGCSGNRPRDLVQLAQLHGFVKDV